MMSKELHTQKIVPLRLELQKLEAEYREQYRKECGEIKVEWEEDTNEED